MPYQRRGCRNLRAEPGTITGFHPPGGPGVRVDTHIYSGYRVPSNYDSMIGKLIARRTAKRHCRACVALSEMVVDGIKTKRRAAAADHARQGLPGRWPEHPLPGKRLAERKKADRADLIGAALDMKRAGSPPFSVAAAPAHARRYSRRISACRQLRPGSASSPADARRWARSGRRSPWSRSNRSGHTTGRCCPPAATQRMPLCAR